ncbi:MAG: glycosyltransferase family 39 protein [Bacteroidota bacterium]
MPSSEHSESVSKALTATRDDSFLLLIAFLKLTFHLAVNALSAYGYFRDEFYYLACSDRLDWGFVDHPPLSIAILTVIRAVLGDSLVAVRLLPALAGAVTVYLAGLMARELGGGTFARILAAIAAFAAPILLGMNSIYSMNSFDFLVWSLTAYVLIRIIKTGNQQLWMLLGALLGVGLMNKIGVMWLGAGIALGLLISHRSWLTTRGPWIAGEIALLLFLPYVVWNVANDFAHLEFIRNATSEKYSSLTAVKFILEQILLQNPVSLPLWIGGLWFFFFSDSGKQFRILGIMYATAFAILVINQQSKAEYLSPAYPMLFAGGAVWFEQALKGKAAILRPMYVGLVAVSGAILSPLAAPVLPVESYIAYANMLGIKPSTAENKELAELPQFYADMFGWEELAATVITVNGNLSPDEKKRSVIYTQNYGEAGAIEFFGKSYGITRVISGHNNYYLWGPGTDSIDVVIIVGGDPEDHRQNFESVELVARSKCRYCMPYENNLPIFVARKLKRPVREVWPFTKNFS